MARQSASSVTFAAIQPASPPRLLKPMTHPSTRRSPPTPDQLQNCSILLVAYGSRLGDVGYIIRPRDFLDPVAAPK